VKTGAALIVLCVSLFLWSRHSEHQREHEHLKYRREIVALHIAQGCESFGFDAVACMRYAHTVVDGLTAEQLSEYEHR
jgi:hypothetical protein